MIAAGLAGPAPAFCGVEYCGLSSIEGLGFQAGHAAREGRGRQPAGNIDQQLVGAEGFVRKVRIHRRLRRAAGVSAGPVRGDR